MPGLLAQENRDVLTLSPPRAGFPAQTLIAGNPRKKWLTSRHHTEADFIGGGSSYYNWVPRQISQTPGKKKNGGFT